MARKPSETKRNTIKVRIRKGRHANLREVAYALRTTSDDGTADFTRLDSTDGSIANLFSETGIKHSSWLSLRPKLEEIGLFYSDEEIEIFNPKELATQLTGNDSSPPEIGDPTTVFGQGTSSSFDNCAGASTSSPRLETTPLSITPGPPEKEALCVSQGHEATPPYVANPQSGPQALESVLSARDGRATSAGHAISGSPLLPNREMDSTKWLGTASSLLAVGLLGSAVLLLSRFWTWEPESGHTAPNSIAAPVPELATEPREPARKETQDESAVPQLSYSVVSKPSTIGWDIGNRDADLDLDIRIAHSDNVKNLNELEGPLESGDSLKIRLFSKRPQYHQLFWLDSSGGVYRLYPEDTAVHSQSSTIELPPARDDFFVVKAEVEGLHAIVAMASQAPFNQSLSLEPLPQPSSRISFEQGAIFFDRQGIVDNPNRSNPIASSRTATKHDPIGVLSSLTKSNANNRADVVRAVCFVIELN